MKYFFITLGPDCHNPVCLELEQVVSELLAVSLIVGGGVRLNCIFV